MAELNEQTRTKEPMKRDLFNELDRGLKQVFKDNVIRDAHDQSSSQTYGINAAQSAQALMQLYRDFKPED